jgi:hypothetical protein
MIKQRLENSIMEEINPYQSPLHLEEPIKSFSERHPRLYESMINLSSLALVTSGTLAVMYLKKYLTGNF